MLVSNKKFSETVEYLEEQISFIEKRYWALFHKHDRLLKHFNLNEIHVDRIELRSKSGPEEFSE